MREGGENYDKLCVTDNSTHVLPVHDVNYIYLPPAVFVDLTNFEGLQIVLSNIVE